MQRRLLFAILLLATLAYFLPSPGPEPAETDAVSVAKPPARAPATATAPASPPSPGRSFAAALAEVRRLEDCYDREDCEFPQTDPRSYHFALSGALALAILDAERAALGEPGQLSSLAALARAEFQNPEPHVQAAALAVLSRLPASEESLAALGFGLRNTPDASLVAQAVRELARYLGTPLEGEAQRIVGELVARGAHFSAEQAATMVLPFINEHSVEEFRRLLGEMVPGSSAATFLNAALAEYERQASGG